jgi:glycosyltransferase involved in cell wall biosynthesis
MAVSKGQTPCAAKIGTVPGGCHPQYVTFVNPQATKGVFVFARIAEELARRRPDIPLLVVEGRGRAGLMKQAGIDLARLGNVRTMANTPDPREFYAVTKLLVMPSLWNESFGLVAAEAMINGIPVLASSRGALPETLGYGPHPGPLPEVEGAYLFDIPVQYTPQSRTLPAAEEVLPWVEMIERLWDDGEFYRQSSEAARARAECWRPERLAETYRQFFSSITPQPGPPIVPQHRAPDRAYGSSGPSISPHPA